VGKYLHTATVKIIDTSCFPDDAVRDECLGGNAAKVMVVEPATLVWYFLKCAWSLDATRAGTKKMIWSLQFGSLVAVLNIFVMLRTVATLTDATQTAATKKGLLAVYMLLWIVPFAGTHYLAYRQQYWKVGGSLKKHLQVLLLKK
jgi:F0F1-type ATP synthase assembly protein I